MPTNTPVSFERWFSQIFDHPVQDPPWYQALDAHFPRISAGTRIAYLTRLFETPGSLLAAYSDAQVDQGLSCLFAFDVMFDLKERIVPLDLRLRCIRSMTTLFRGCFEQRCPPVLSHLDEPDASPLNSVCYMWWDSLPLIAQRQFHPRRSSSGALDEAVLQTMREILQSSSAACQEGALHGLGHWAPYCSEPAEIIDEFLGRNRHIRKELHQYALRARIGCVQ